jgi:membrane protein implicated in regulation of membrane protease activity
VDVIRRHPFDNLGAWLLIVLGGLLLVAGATSFVRAALDSDWVQLLVTVALMVLIAFGIAHAVGQLRRDRSPRSDSDGDES